MIGLLNDKQICEAAEDNKLITHNFEKENVKQTCYELRAGNVYFDLNNEGKRIEVKDDDIIPFRPHQRIVIMTKEKLKIPENVLARIITKGSLFSIGISPVCTYADPGFCGNLGIVMQNVSNDYIKLKCGDAIAKIEFEQFEHPVNEIYRGQHGFETEVWPIRTDRIMDTNEIKKFFPNQKQVEEIRYAFGDSVSETYNRIVELERKWIFVTIVFLLVNLLLIAVLSGTEWLGPTSGVVLGFITNAIFLIVQTVINGVRGKR